MSSLFDIWFEFWTRKKLGFLIFLIVIAGILAFGIVNLNVSGGIEKVIPQGEKFNELNTIVKDKGLNSSLIFKINDANADNLSHTGELADQFRNELETLNDLVEPAYSEDSLVSKYSDFILNYYPLLLNGDSLALLQSRFDESNYAPLLEKLKVKMTSFGGSFSSSFFAADPLGLSGPLFLQLNAQSEDRNVFIHEDWTFSRLDSSAIIIYDTKFDGIDEEKALLLKSKLDALISAFGTEHQGVTIDYFGPFLVTAENGLIIKKDTRLITILSVSFILLLLLLIYKNVITPLFFALPIIGGLLFAFGLIGYLGFELSTLSLATSAIVLGIVLDYSFHYFTHLKENNDPFLTTKDIYKPLVTGSLTTILAFAALTLVNSKILNDFGMITSLTLLGALLFVITTLPIIIKLTSFRLSKESVLLNKYISFRVDFKLKTQLILLSLIGIITVFFWIYTPSAKFNGDLSLISYQTKDIVALEQELTGLNPLKEQKVYFFLEHDNYDSLCYYSEQLTSELESLKQDSGITYYIGANQFLISKSQVEQKLAEWKSFHTNKFNRDQFNFVADSLGFDTTFFKPFYNKISSYYTPEVSPEVIYGTPYEKFYYQDSEGSHHSTFVAVVPSDKIEHVQTRCANINGLDIFNRQSLARTIISQVKDDFNFILYTTASIVFLILLLIYGRIELTLLAFLPMVISWVWILGITSLLGIEFNFVNIVITTFIFGLGDDFSIFMLDGLLNKHKSGKDKISTNNAAINLSALTTLFGTGILFFAEHPAINSISLISVLGIVCILLISKLVQPIIFNLFVTKRVQKGLPPIRFFTLLMSIFVFSYFFLGCVILNIGLIIVILLPVSKKKKRVILNYAIHYLVKSMLAVGFNTRKKTVGKDNLTPKNPGIIIANHSSFLDILLMIALTPKAVIMVKDWVYNSPFFGAFVRFAGYIYNGNDPEKTIGLIETRIKEGYYVIIFPEGTRSADGKVKRFHKGAFLAAQQLKLSITPVIITGAHWCMSKNDFILNNGTMVSTILPKIEDGDSTFGESYQEKTKSISRLFKQKFNELTLSDDGLRNIGIEIQNKYLYKGPILEWYFRIKWRFEKHNFKYYATRLQPNRILDVGCGYGYFSIFLSETLAPVRITGIDYDEEKIEIAKGCVLDNPDIHFLSGDVLTLSLEGEFDTIFLNDVLHYLNQENQKKLMDKLYTYLAPNGLLFIRDGIRSASPEHNKTERTEFFSTRLGFNKKVQDFYFPTKEEYLSLGEQYGMSVTFEKQENSLSNGLFIYQKQ